MKTSKPTVVIRLVLGLLFVAGPLCTALHLVPEPALPRPAAAFTEALAATHYMLPLLWSIEIGSGLLLLSGFMVPLALVMLTPVIVNIAAFHLFLAPSGISAAIVVGTLELFLAWRYRRAFAPLFQSAYGSQTGDEKRFTAQSIRVQEI